MKDAAAIGWTVLGVKYGSTPAASEENNQSQYWFNARWAILAGSIGLDVSHGRRRRDNEFVPLVLLVVGPSVVQEVDE